MPKAVKLKNDNYVDSSSITNNRENLSDIIANFNNIANNRVKINLIKELNYTSFSEGNIGVNCAEYQFVIIKTIENVCILMVANTSGTAYLFAEDWVDNADRLFRRSVWFVGNDIHFTNCYSYGINGYSAFAEYPSRLVPKQIYGIL